MRTFLLTAVVLMGFAASAFAADKPHRYGLLVGVTEYPGLARELWLEGPANDGPMLRDLLCEKFGFAREDIVILSEIEGKKDPQLLPTHANIERECKKLAEKAKAGDQVIVQLAGHGSQQPEPAGVKHPNPDGFDRIFLPRDVKDWDTKPEAVPNALPGRELADWLRPIPEHKASLWVIVDACHSGEMLRGISEKARQLDPVKSLKVPAEALDRAKKRAADRAGKSPADTGMSPSLARLDGVALLYACQSNEVTVERRFPAEGPEAKSHGLLTYTLTRLLRSSDQPLTYGELTRRIQAEYVGMERTFPTPVLEGADSNRVVFGRDSIQRSTMLLTEADETLSVNAGQLHGLALGSILAVHSPPGEKDELRGHVKITRILTSRCEVEPCEFGSKKTEERKRLVGGRCEVAQVDFGDAQLTLGVDRLGSKATVADLDALTADVKALTTKPGSPATFCEDQKQAEWLVRLSDGNVTLLRASEWSANTSETKPTLLGPQKFGPGVADWLTDTCTRVVRAQNLLKLAARLPGDESGDFAPQVKCETVRRGATPGGGVSVATLYDGDRVQFKLTNTGKVPVDVTLLYVDSRFGISALFPSTENNRIRPGVTIVTPSETVRSTTTGREHVVVLAVKSEGLQPVDFVSLAQKNVDEARRDEKKRGKSALGSPLGRLLRSAVYRDGTTRAMGRSEVANYAAELIPVQIEPGKRPEK
jgi:Caspase domain